MFIIIVVKTCLSEYALKYLNIIDILNSRIPIENKLNKTNPKVTRVGKNKRD